MIMVQHVEKRFGQHMALAGLELTVAPREVFALPGANGEQVDHPQPAAWLPARGQGLDAGGRHRSGNNWVTGTTGSDLES